MLYHLLYQRCYLLVVGNIAGYTSGIFKAGSAVHISRYYGGTLLRKGHSDGTAYTFGMSGSSDNCNLALQQVAGA